MRTKKALFIISILLTSNCFAQIDALTIVDKVVGSLLPTVTEGVNNIVEAKKKNKDEEALKLKDQFEKDKEAAIKVSKEKLIGQISYEIEYLETIHNIHNKVLRISNSVGRLTIFKDDRFIEVLQKQNSTITKHAILLKFQNALQKINKNEGELRALRNQIKSNNLVAGAKAADYIGTIISKLDEINATYDDAPKLTTLVGKGSTTTKNNVNACLAAIQSIMQDIGILESQIESLNRETSEMVRGYLGRLNSIKDKLGEE